MKVPSAAVDLPGIGRHTFEDWAQSGLVQVDKRGSGYLRSYPAPELRAARALDSLRRLAGIDPARGTGNLGSPTRQAPVIALQRTVAELARTNEPGTAHEITTPVPWVRHVLIVPEP